jgi:ribose transport system substrate-binding protein
MSAALARLPGELRLAIISFNDDAAVGALRAVRQLGREEAAVIVGQGADRIARTEIRNPGSCLIGSSAYWPEKYGERLIEVALKILRGEPVPPAVYNEHILISKENIDIYYPESGDSLVPELSSATEGV